MGKKSEIVLTEELEKKIIRLYTEKGMSLNLICKLVCPRKLAKDVLVKHGLLKNPGGRLKSREFNLGHLSYETSWEDLQKSKNSD